MKTLILILLLTGAACAQSQWTYAATDGRFRYEVYDAQHQVSDDGDLYLSFWVRVSTSKRKLIKVLYVGDCENNLLIPVAGGLSGSRNIIFDRHNLILATGGLERSLTKACGYADDRLLEALF